MKILLVNKYHYFRGGSETYYFGLAELLKKAGHEVIFFAMQDDRNIPCAQEKYFVKNIDFNGHLSVKEKAAAAVNMVYSREAKRKFRQLLQDERPDIIHINLFHRVLTASIVDAAKEAGIPVVFTMHDLNCICPNHTMLSHGEICEKCLHGNYLHCVKDVCFKGSRAKCAMAAIESAYNRMSGLYDKIDLFITPSEFYRQKLHESGCTTSPVFHIKNFLPDGTEYAVKSGRGEYVLYYGRLSWEKGILTAVKAMQYLDEKKLIIAGTGEEEERIRELVHGLHLEGRVELAGFRSGKDLWDLVDGSACVVVPSEWYEASGYTACEAQARGKIVVVSDGGGLPENIIDGKTGFVFPMKDTEKLAKNIRKVYEMSEEEYKKMADSSVKNAKDLFDADTYIQNITELYKLCCRARSERTVV